MPPIAVANVHFLSVFSVYHDTGNDKRPGKHLHNRICLPGLSDLYNSSGHIHPVYFLPLSEFHIALDAEVRSIQPVKFHSRAVYLRQSPQFIFRIIQSQMRVGIHRYADVRMAHQVLQRLRIHPRPCHVRAVGVASYMRRNRRHLYSVDLIVTVDRIPKIVLPVQGDQRFSVLVVVKKTGVSLYLIFSYSLSPGFSFFRGLYAAGFRTDTGSTFNSAVFIKHLLMILPVLIERPSAAI